MLTMCPLAYARRYGKAVRMTRIEAKTSMARFLVGQYRLGQGQTQSTRNTGDESAPYLRQSLDRQRPLYRRAAANTGQQ